MLGNGTALTATALMYIFIPINFSSPEKEQQQRMGTQQQLSANPALIAFPIKKEVAV